jgi:copper chaperone
MPHDLTQPPAGATSTYTVKGMTCEHCVRAVTTEISALEGVQGVEVDLDSGRVSVVSAGTLDDAAVAAAVDEAGYELVGRA